jgi:non-heme chloroperoxidase
MRLPAILLLLIGGLTSPAKAEYVKVSDDLTIHYEVSGKGTRTILLVPGWTMTTQVFEKQLEHYANSTEYKVIAIDPRSQGLSTHTLEGNFYEQRGRDLSAFIKALNLTNIVLGGWSSGGFDVLSYVHQFGSSNLAGFIMIDATPKAIGTDNSNESNEWIWFTKDDAGGSRRWFTQGVLLDRQNLNEEFAKSMVDNPTPKYLKWVLGMTNQTGDTVAALLNESGCYQDYEADLRAMEGKVPLLYYASAPKANVENWARQNTPSATVVRFGKHLSFWEHPEVFNAALDQLLQSGKN